MSEINKLNLNLFKILQISENNIDLSIYICDICNKNSNTISIFDSCNHTCCVSCVDNLYDSYLNKDKSVIFECPFCSSKVYDIVYKK
jgi:hypothetical protein